MGDDVKYEIKGTAALKYLISPFLNFQFYVSHTLHFLTFTVLTNKHIR